MKDNVFLSPLSRDSTSSDLTLPPASSDMPLPSSFSGLELPSSVLSNSAHANQHYETPENINIRSHDDSRRRLSHLQTSRRSGRSVRRDQRVYNTR